MGKKWFAALVKKIFVCQSKEKDKGSQRVTSPSPRALSHRIVSTQAQAATSQRIASSPIIMINKESESTLRDYHATSAIKIQASFRGYMARRRFKANKGLLGRLQGVVQQPHESQNNQAFESFESESMTQARQYQNQKQVWLNLLDRQLHPNQPLKNYRLTPGRTNSSLKSPSRNYKQSYSFLTTSSRSSVLMSSKQPRTPPSSRMLQGSSNSGVNKYSRSRASRVPNYMAPTISSSTPPLGRMLQGSSSSSVKKYHRSRANRVPNYMAPTVSSKAKVSYWVFQDTRWQGV